MECVSFGNIVNIRVDQRLGFSTFFLRHPKKLVLNLAVPQNGKRNQMISFIAQKIDYKKNLKEVRKTDNKTREFMRAHSQTLNKINGAFNFAKGAYDVKDLRDA